MSLRTRILLILWAIEGITLGIIITGHITYLYREELNDAGEHARETSILLRTTLGEGLITKNFLLVEEVARIAFIDSTFLDRITVTDELGELITDHIKGHFITSDHNIEVSAPIFVGSNCFGIVTIVYSTERLLKDLKKHTFVLSSIALFGMAVSGLIAWKILSKVVLTLQELNDGVQSLSVGITPLPIESYCKDNELGALVESFNQLIIKSYKQHPYEVVI